jgi:hypothetical protein
MMTSYDSTIWFHLSYGKDVIVLKNQLEEVWEQSMLWKWDPYLGEW